VAVAVAVEQETASPNQAMVVLEVLVAVVEVVSLHLEAQTVVAVKAQPVLVVAVAGQMVDLVAPALLSYVI
jgi:hypothetical protein